MIKYNILVVTMRIKIRLRKRACNELSRRTFFFRVTWEKIHFHTNTSTDEKLSQNFLSHFPHSCYVIAVCMFAHIMYFKSLAAKASLFSACWALKICEIPIFSRLNMLHLCGCTYIKWTFQILPSYTKTFQWQFSSSSHNKTRFFD